MAVFTPHQVHVTDAGENSFLYRRSTVRDNRFNVGDKYETSDGRIFRYCKAFTGSLSGRGAINGHIIPGDSGHGYEGAFQVSASAGDFVIRVADTTAAATRPANYYQGGDFVAFGFTDADIFVAKIVKSSVGNGTYVELTLDAGLPEAVTTSNGVTAYPSIYNYTRAGMAQLQDFEAFICVPKWNVTALQYYWGQTRGPTWVTAHGGTWPGSSAALRDVYFHIDGTIDPATIRDVGTLSPQRAGYLLHAGSSGSYGDGVIMLQLE